MEKYYLIIFINTLDAMEAESVLKENNIPVTIMPTPTNITKSCGISIRIEIDYIEKVLKIKDRGKIKIKNIYVQKNSNYELYV
ncbi:DUF3343 domain-containing protein [Clostridium lundense]|uniref:DUF3343 domain-containing protein n=1 Tax=Clostridium lundense TaxID=319475 RepID=UPI0004889E18|nr:DUF3343 domain-containing protein [Clostridium lundense]